MVVRPLRAAGRLSITNHGTLGEDVSVLVEGRMEPSQHRALAPGEIWSMPIGTI